jgi:hypothetical protein
MTIPKPTRAELIYRSMTYFEGGCGHRWVGATGGSFACPVCGLHDGDRHLAFAEKIPVQIEDWGCAWEWLHEESTKMNEERMAMEERYDNNLQ